MKILKAAFKPAVILIAAATIITACKSSTNENNQADSTNKKMKPGNVSKRTQDGCYMYVSGAQMRDTLFVQLHIQNGNVSGRMMDIPYEKDSRKGTLTGAMHDDNTISAVWKYMQEGVTDTVTMAFRLTQTALYRKPLKADTVTGKQVTDMAAPYSIELRPTDCNKE